MCPAEVQKYGERTIAKKKMGERERQDSGKFIIN